MEIRPATGADAEAGSEVLRRSIADGMTMHKDLLEDLAQAEVPA